MKRSRYQPNLKNDNRGITLVELLVAMAILSLVLAIGYRAFDVGHKYFEKGETAANVQQNLRLVSSEITNLVRYASEVTILDEGAWEAEDKDTGTEDGYTYIYINDEGKLEMEREDNSYVFSDTLMSNTVLTLEFTNVTKEEDEDEDGTLLGINVGYKIVKEDQDDEVGDYNIETDIAILNLQSRIEGSITGVAIRIF